MVPGHPQAARAICARCPVAPQCLDYAVTLPATDTGIWAGPGPRERTALRRPLRAAQPALDQVLGRGA